MNRNYKSILAFSILTAALVGCSSSPKVEKVKPNPLPKISQVKVLLPVATYSGASNQGVDGLRLQGDVSEGMVFVADAKGTVTAYRGKTRLWEKKVSKQGVSAGVEAADGMVIVGNKKGELFALDQVTGEQIWRAQLTGSILAPSLIQANRVVTVANDGTVFAHNLTTGQQMWTYSLPNVQLSLRGQAAPVAIDDRNVLIAAANAYVYAIDTVTGVPRMQRRVAINDGRSDIQRLNDIDGDPVIYEGRLLITTSFQGQVTVTDLATQQVLWSEDASSIRRPEVFDNKVFVSKDNGEIVAFDLRTGQKLWTNDQLLNRELSNPVVLGNDLVVGDLDGVLHLISPAAGQLLGRSKTSGEVRSLRVIDNQLYVTTKKGALSIWQTR